MVKRIFPPSCSLPLSFSSIPFTRWKLKERNQKHQGEGLTECVTYSGVEAQVTDVTGDDGFLLGRSHAKGVVDHCLLHRVHLRGETHTHMNTLVLLPVLSSWPYRIIRMRLVKASGFFWRVVQTGNFGEAVLLLPWSCKTQFESDLWDLCCTPSFLSTLLVLLFYYWFYFSVISPLSNKGNNNRKKEKE